MAVNNKVLTGLRLQFDCLCHHIALYDRRVAPISLLQSGRKHILGDFINSLSVLACLMWKSRREKLVGSPPHQHRITCREQLQRVFFGLAIEVGRSPQVGISHHAIEGYERRFSYFSRNLPPALTVITPSAFA